MKILKQKRIVHERDITIIKIETTRKAWYTITRIVYRETERDKNLEKTERIDSKNKILTF